MQTLSSANRTCSALASAVEWTATVATPSSRQARMTRRAISPRLAMRTFLNTPVSDGAEGLESASGRVDAEQWLSELHRLPVPHEDLQDLSGDLRFDLVHQLHRFDDAEHLA